MPRQYNKKSQYWDKFNAPKNDVSQLINPGEPTEWEPELMGDSYYKSEASSSTYSRNSSTGGSTHTRSNRAANNVKADRFKNIEEGMLPYQYGADGVSIRKTIELCQKAYANVAIFRNSIDMMSDFTNSPLDVVGGNAASQKFIKAWFKRINMWDLKDQWFREYYTTSNIFLYIIEGELKVDDFSNFRKLGLRARKNKLPLKYVLLNPYDVSSNRSTSFEGGGFAKILSEYELTVLRDPRTDKDKAILEGLPQDVQDRIKKGNFDRDGISIPLDPEKLRYAFYKKQDYHPFATPFGYAVLDDINFKLELKKIDQAICRTMENVVLLITMGNTPDKGGVVPSNMTAMQSLFRNESVGRVLVSDYTTKGEFLIPDLKKVLGPEKYEIVNQDIKEGLQNIIVSQDKFANTSVKAELFLQRLKEGREAFLHNFLQPEIDRICKNFGFKKVPEARFETIDLSDKTEMHRVITRMMELGILPPEEGIEVIETGLFPERSKLRPAQERYAKDREKGLYNPLVGGVPVIPPAESPDGVQANPADRNKTPKATGRPAGASKATYSVKSISSVVEDTNDLYKSLEKSAKTIYGKKRLNASQKEIIKDVALSSIQCSEPDGWLQTASNCLKDPYIVVGMKTLPGVDELAAKHGLDLYSASLLYHSSKK
jgi:hypothetical protein